MNNKDGQVLGRKQRECLMRSPYTTDVVVYEVSLQILFNQGIEREAEKEALEQLEATGRELALILHRSIRTHING